MPNFSRVQETFSMLPISTKMGILRRKIPRMLSIASAAAKMRPPWLCAICVLNGFISNAWASHQKRSLSTPRRRSSSSAPCAPRKNANPSRKNLPKTKLLNRKWQTGKGGPRPVQLCLRPPTSPPKSPTSEGTSSRSGRTSPRRERPSRTPSTSSQMRSTWWRIRWAPKEKIWGKNLPRSPAPSSSQLSTALIAWEGRNLFPTRRSNPKLWRMICRPKGRRKSKKSWNKITI